MEVKNMGNPFSKGSKNTNDNKKIGNKNDKPKKDTKWT